MLIDGISNPGVDLSIMSDEFSQRDIIWIIVALQTPAFKIWGSYHTLAGDTGINKLFIHLFLNYLQSISFENCRW